MKHKTTSGLTSAISALTTLVDKFIDIYIENIEKEIEVYKEDSLELIKNDFKTCITTELKTAVS